MRDLETRFGLKFNPFRPDVPVEALYTSPAVDAFIRRVGLGIAGGGYVMITGDPGSGKSAVLRLLKRRLEETPDIAVGIVQRPRSHVSDFYRELGDLFGVSLSTRNRWGGFKALRAKWSEHIATTLTRPVLVLDEAQDVLNDVFAEIRTLGSEELDSKQLLCVIVCGDKRLMDRLSSPELLPFGSRIRRRLQLDYAEHDELLACLEHLIDAAGNSALMTDQLKATLVEHAAGNYRVLMNLCDELLLLAAERDLATLDEELYLDAFAPPTKSKRRRS